MCAVAVLVVSVTCYIQFDSGKITVRLLQLSKNRTIVLQFAPKSWSPVFAFVGASCGLLVWSSLGISLLLLVDWLRAETNLNPYPANVDNMASSDQC